MKKQIKKVNWIKKKNCLLCKREFMGKNTKWHIKLGRGVYCSRKCSSSATRKRLITNCMRCNKSIEIVASRENRFKYCSMACVALGNMGEHGYWYGKKRPNLITSTSFKKGLIPWNMGLKGFLGGDKHWNWQGGITPLNEVIRKSFEYREWRVAVLKRDNYTCIMCGEAEDLEADHIKPFALFPELRLDINNGRTLCVECHKKTPTWGRKALSSQGGGAYV